MKIKISNHFIALLLSAMIFSGCDQTTDQSIENWTTYTNEEHGYSFDYPSDCTFGAMPPNCKSQPPEERPPECLCFLDSQNPDQVFMQAFLGEVDELNLAGININYNDMPLFNPPPGTQLVPWIKSEFSQMHEDIPDEPNYEIDKMPAVRIHTPKSPMAPSYENIYFLLEGKLFNIQLLDVDNEGNKELYEQILASFHIEG